MKKIQQKFAVPFQYDVVFTNGIFKTAQPLLAHLISEHASTLPAKVLVCIDEGVVNHHPRLLEDIKTYFHQYKENIALCGDPLIFPGGEISKNDRKFVDLILDAINLYGVDRHSYTLAIGGGAVLDMVGFASTIAHRGIRHIRIPTTVLSQNDSGVGVKNSINAFDKKNFLGCFAPPFAVINDFDFLTTLEDRDWRSGISEAIKVALIKDKSFFEFLETRAGDLRNRDMEAMETLIVRCAELHMEHISGGDPFEMGSSRPLDFGHWAAHKLEQLTRYQLRHGEAVAIGIALDVTYAQLLGILDKSEWHRILRLIKSLDFELFVPELLQKQNDRLEVLHGLDEFREHLGGKLTVMQLETIGRGVNVHQMNDDLIIQAIHILEESHKLEAV